MTKKVITEVSKKEFLLVKMTIALIKRIFSTVIKQSLKERNLFKALAKQLIVQVSLKTCLT